MKKKSLLMVIMLACLLTLVAGCFTKETKKEELTPKKYTVTFDSQGGTTVAAVIAEENKIITEPTPPTKVGFTFEGWYTEVAYTKAWSFTSDKVNADTILYAKWNEIVTSRNIVYFDSNGGTTVSAITNITSGTMIVEPTPPTKLGYTFEGWYKEVGLTTVWNFSTDKVTTDITLYAKWSEIIVPKYTATFNSNGGTTVAAIANITSGAIIAEPTAPTKTGYGFEGWYKEATLTTAWNFAIDKVTADITLYAKWRVNNYTIAFNTNGGTTIAAIIADYNTAIAEPTAPTKFGYIFVGWYKEATLATAWNFAADNVVEDITLYAKWTVNNFTVTFDTNGGTTIAAITNLSSGAIIAAPNAPTKTGYAFGGWYKESELTTAWNFATDKVTGDINLYANWKSFNSGTDFEAIFAGETCEIVKYLGSSEEVVIPFHIKGRKVTSIGRMAFENKKLTSVIIPPTVTYIGVYAFIGNKLTRITIPDTVTMFDLYSIDSQTIINSKGENIIKYNDDFMYAQTSKGIIILKNISTSKSLIIPDNINGITVNAIGHIACSSDYTGTVISSVIIPDSVTSIGEVAFCTNLLTSVYIPSSVTSIEDGAFHFNPLKEFRGKAGSTAEAYAKNNNITFIAE